MEERSLRVYNSDKTFFSKLTSTITKIIIPTQVGINSVLISMKRNNMLKAYENTLVETDSQEKKDALSKKFEDLYALYLEAVDKHVMDSIYKKVKNDTATDFEKNALSKYYLITHLKENEYLEYKYKKQIYLLELDYQSVLDANKPKTIDRFKKFYVKEMETLYKGVLKHYSIKLADTLTYGTKEDIYNKIFNVLEEYILNILPLKIEQDKSDDLKKIADDYNAFEKFTVGKLDQNDNIEKNIILLSISRKLFTHSLPLVVAEQCYIKILKDIRSLIVDTRIAKKQEKAYALLINLIEEYNIKLLSTKIYWDKPSEREEYKEFWKKYQKISELKDTNKDEYIRQKEILFIKSDLQKVLVNENKYCKIIRFYKNKLVEFGVMKRLKDSYSSDGNYRKTLVKEAV